MGTCRSTCAQSTDLEYYEAWRKEQPMRSSRRRATVVMDRSLRHQRSTRRHTKLWVCDRGCCSIRWKLDYAEFQSYMKYAEISPYVVEQTNHDGCVCVICRGLSDQFLQCRLNPTELRKASTTLSETDDEEDEPQENETSRSHVASPVA